MLLEYSYIHSIFHTIYIIIRAFYMAPFSDPYQHSEHLWLNKRSPSYQGDNVYDRFVLCRWILRRRRMLKFSVVAQNDTAVNFYHSASQSGATTCVSSFAFLVWGSPMCRAWNDLSPWLLWNNWGIFLSTSCTVMDGIATHLPDGKYYQEWQMLATNLIYPGIIYPNTRYLRV